MIASSHRGGIWLRRRALERFGCAHTCTSSLRTSSFFFYLSNRSSRSQRHFASVSSCLFFSELPHHRRALKGTKLFKTPQTLRTSYRPMLVCSPSAAWCFQRATSLANCRVSPTTQRFRPMKSATSFAREGFSTGGGGRVRTGTACTPPARVESEWSAGPRPQDRECERGRALTEHCPH